MEKTDKVRILGPNTDIEFTVKGMKAIPCCGTANIPDGELYTAPIKESVNGVITYNTPSPYRGNIFNNISKNKSPSSLGEGLLWCSCGDSNSGHLD